MKDNPFQLSEKSIVLLSPITNLATNFIFQLTEMGADVALVGDGALKAERLKEEIGNQRDIDRNKGRLFLVDLPPTPENANEIIGQAASVLGGIDAFTSLDLLSNGETEKAVSDILREAFERRRKGRLLFLMTNPEFMPRDNRERETLSEFAREMSSSLAVSDSTINCLAIGLTEEFLLNTYPNCNVNDAANKFRDGHPSAKLIDPVKTSRFAAVLLSSLGSGVNGQTISIS